MDYLGKLIKALELKYKTTISVDVVYWHFCNLDGEIVLALVDKGDVLFTLNAVEYFGATNSNKFGCLSTNLTFYYTHLISNYFRRKFVITEAFVENGLLVMEATHSSGDGITSKVVCKYDANSLYNVLKQLKGTPEGFDFDSWYFITQDRLFADVNVKVAVTSLEKIITIISTL